MSYSRCYTCQADLQGTDLRVHLRSEWHIHNLKRVAASLVPFTKFQFQMRQYFLGAYTCASTNKNVWLCIITATQDQIEGIRTVSFSKLFYSLICDVRLCLLRHFQCRKREEACKVDAKDSKDEDVENKNVETINSSGNFGQPLPVGACLFCNVSFANSPKSEASVLRHMEETHNFVLPFSERLLDGHGLLAELGRLVGEEFTCLGCGRKFFGRRKNRHKRSPSQLREEALRAVRMHMIDKEHNFLYVGEEDPVVVALAVNEMVGGRESEQSLPPIARVGGELYSQFYVCDKANRTIVLPDNADEGDEVYEVRLPTGGVIGHRRYYRTVFQQNVGSYLREAAEHQNRLALMAGCEGAGGRRHISIKGTKCGTLANSSHGISDVLRTEVLPLTSTLVRRSKDDLKLGLRGNYFLRGHFRRQY
ncbi:unnamed protein product [Hydatigera taeniaeformis]|uniref:Zf-C2H2_2 domain-containing protein n=1 Tax=Hydatigena taeniaeformis TaxID=6205 RepID=A0A0R3X5G2_HYDTA|nr:unnamed protein product [Hydatigera taeniaeformis]